MQPYGDNFVPVITPEPVHTLDQPFCLDTTCGCHEDQLLVGEIQRQISEGLITLPEATRIVQGKQV
jgi:hypothetical protein